VRSHQRRAVIDRIGKNNEFLIIFQISYFINFFGG